MSAGGLRGALGVVVVMLGASCAAATVAPAAAPVTSAASPPAEGHGAECRRIAPATCEGSLPSYERDVAPILTKRCFACHAGSGMAADDHDFGKFPTLFAQRQRVAVQVAACAMPPRKAAPLPPDEAATLLRWVACGAPKD